MNIDELAQAARAALKDEYADYDPAPGWRTRSSAKRSTANGSTTSVTPPRPRPSVTQAGNSWPCPPAG